MQPARSRPWGNFNDRLYFLAEYFFSRDAFPTYFQPLQNAHKEASTRREVTEEVIIVCDHANHEMRK